MNTEILQKTSCPWTDSIWRLNGWYWTLALQPSHQHSTQLIAMDGSYAVVHSSDDLGNPPFTWLSFRWLKGYTDETRQVPWLARFNLTAKGRNQEPDLVLSAYRTSGRYQQAISTHTDTASAAAPKWLLETHTAFADAFWLYVMSWLR